MTQDTKTYLENLTADYNKKIVGIKEEYKENIEKLKPYHDEYDTISAEEKRLCREYSELEKALKALREKQLAISHKRRKMEDAIDAATIKAVDSFSYDIYPRIIGILQQELTEWFNTIPGKGFDDFLFECEHEQGNQLWGRCITVYLSRKENGQEHFLGAYTHYTPLESISTLWDEHVIGFKEGLLNELILLYNNRMFERGQKVYLETLIMAMIGVSSHTIPFAEWARIPSDILSGPYNYWGKIQLYRDIDASTAFIKFLNTGKSYKSHPFKRFVENHLFVKHTTQEIVDNLPVEHLRKVCENMLNEGYKAVNYTYTVNYSDQSGREKVLEILRLIDEKSN